MNIRKTITLGEELFDLLQHSHRHQEDIETSYLVS